MLDCCRPHPGLWLTVLIGTFSGLSLRPRPQRSGSSDFSPLTNAGRNSELVFFSSTTSMCWQWLDHHYLPVQRHLCLDHSARINGKERPVVDQSIMNLTASSQIWVCGLNTYRWWKIWFQPIQPLKSSFCVFLLFVFTNILKSRSYLYIVQ